MITGGGGNEWWAEWQVYVLLVDRITQLTTGELLRMTYIYTALEIRRVTCADYRLRTKGSPLWNHLFMLYCMYLQLPI